MNDLVVTYQAFSDRRGC